TDDRHEANVLEGRLEHRQDHIKTMLANVQQITSQMNDSLRWLTNARLGVALQELAKRHLEHQVRVAHTLKVGDCKQMAALYNFRSDCVSKEKGKLVNLSNRSLTGSSSTKGWSQTKTSKAYL
ncbi:hypothetical protein PanWU01x14_313550, partial [Parasponia andersonii]